MMPLILFFGFAAQGTEVACDHLLELPWSRHRVIEPCAPDEYCTERWLWIDPWPVRGCRALVWWAELREVNLVPPGASPWPLEHLDSLPWLDR